MTITQMVLKQSTGYKKRYMVHTKCAPKKAVTRVLDILKQALEAILHKSKAPKTCRPCQKKVQNKNARRH